MSWMPRICAIPSTIAIEGSAGVDGTLKWRLSPVTAFAIVKSVKVPPTSTPIRYIGYGFLLIVCWRVVVALRRASCGGSPMHEPIRGKALDPPVGAAMDDELGQDGADHWNELEAVAGESEGVIGAARVRRGADDGQKVAGLRLHACPGPHDSQPPDGGKEIGRR